MKELFELKFGIMTMDEYERRFLELLRYFDFIKDDQTKIQLFLSALPSISMIRYNMMIPRHWRRQ
jgi:hypothetical protein